MKDTHFQQLQGNMERPITRRRFIQSLLVTWAISYGLPWQFVTAAQEDVTADWPSWLQAVTGEPNAVIRIGKAYLRNHQEEQDADVLMRLIDEALSRSPGLDPSQLIQPGRIAMELKRLVRMEYINDDVISLEGWILSRTEVRLYALAAALETD